MDKEIQRLSKLISEGDDEALEKLGKLLVRKGFLNLGEPNAWVACRKGKFWNGELWGETPLLFGSQKLAEGLLRQRQYFHNGSPEDFQILPLKYFLLPELPQESLRELVPRRVSPSVTSTVINLDEEGNLSPYHPQEPSEEDAAWMAEFFEGDPSDEVDLPPLDLSEELPDVGEVPEIGGPRPRDAQ